MKETPHEASSNNLKIESRQLEKGLALTVMSSVNPCSSRTSAQFPCTSVRLPCVFSNSMRRDAAVGYRAVSNR